MRSLRNLIIVVLLCCTGASFAAVPLIQWVPILLNEVLTYLYPKNQEILYPDTPGMKKLLASKHGFICRTRILVTSPQTVAFYRQKEKVGNYLGITKVGKWLQNDRSCVDNQVVRTLTWDKNGKPSRSVSSKKVSNLNTQLTLVYPQDFKAQKTNTLVTCQAKVLNLSKRPLALYAGKIATDTRVALLKPYQQTQVVAPCFKEQALIGVQVQQNSSQLSVSYYNTPKKYTDINALPVLEFPRQFILQSQQTVELKADLLKLLLAVLYT